MKTTHILIKKQLIRINAISSAIVIDNDLVMQAAGGDIVISCSSREEAEYYFQYLLETGIGKYSILEPTYEKEVKK